MTNRLLALTSAAGDGPGWIRQGLDGLRACAREFHNSDLFIDEATGSFGATVALSSELNDDPFEAALVRIERAARETSARLGITPAENALTIRLIGETAQDGRPPGFENARRLMGTATLESPTRVDYDAPDGAGSQYHELRPFSAFDERMLEATFEAAGPIAGKRVLDVGCGTGRFTRRLSEAAATVTGYDPSATMLAAAQANDAASTYLRGDANEALPAGPWDVITGFYCVQYLSPDAFCPRARDVLADGGVLALATFSHRHIAEIEFAKFFPSLAAIDFARFPSIPDLASRLEQHGFSNVEVRERLVAIEDDPHALLARVERKYLSSFHLLPDAEFRAGIEAMRAAWTGRSAVRRTARGTVVSGRAPRPL